MKTTVIHVNQAPAGFKDNPDFAYIGRANPRRGLKTSIFANPFVIGKHGNRDQVIKKYHAYLLNLLAEKPELLERLDALRGKTLVCWCKPEACHGDVLIELIKSRVQS